LNAEVSARTVHAKRIKPTTYTILPLVSYGTVVALVPMSNLRPNDASKEKIVPTKSGVHHASWKHTSRAMGVWLIYRCERSDHVETGRTS